MGQLDELIGGQYAGVIALQQVGGSYFGENFTLSATQTTWQLKLGEYNGNLGHGPIYLHGYWIFPTGGVNRCWQAVGGGGNGLAYWNQDGLAQGNPENWELFNFFAFQGGFVKIQNTSGQGGYWINLIGNTFMCSGGEDVAAVFSVQFF